MDINKKEAEQTSEEDGRNEREVGGGRERQEQSHGRKAIGTHSQGSKGGT